MKSFNAALSLSCALLIAVSPAAAQCSDVYEPDDTALASTAVIKDAETQHRNFCEDNSDWLRFMACGGQQYTIQTANLGDQADTFLNIYSSDASTILASDDDGNGGLASRIVWTAPTTSIYYLRVRQTDSSYGVDREYDLLLNGPTTACDLWTYSRGDGEWDEAVALIERQDGRVLATGRTQAYPGAYSHAAFLTVSMDGTSSNKAYWYLNGDDVPRAVALDAIGGFLIAGDSTSYLAQGRNSLVIFYGLDGSTLGMVVGGALDDYSNAIATLASGSYAVAGATTSSGSGGLDGWVYRVNNTTSVAWQRTIGGSGNEEIFSVLANGNGDITLAGYTSSYGSGQKDGLVARLDSSGGLLWSRALGTTAIEEFRKVFETPDGGLLLVGTTTGSTFVAAADLWLVRLDGQGQVLWEKTIGGGGDDRVLGASHVGDGYVIAGYSDSATVGNYDGLLIKVNASGDLLWVRTYGGESTDRLYDVIQVVDGSLVAAGYTKSFGVGLANAWLLKVAPDGASGASCTSTISPQMAVHPRSSIVTSPSLTAVAVSGSSTVFGANFTGGGFSNNLLCHVLPPTEVSSPASPTPLRFTTHDDLSWESAVLNQAQFFNLYRDEVALLPLGGYGSCLGALPTNAYADEDVPDPGVGWFYLVTARNGLGEGTMGKDSAGNERANGNPCP